MKLHYKRMGSGQPLIILHGLMGMLDNWQSHARVLSESYDVISVDQRNHGKSPHSNLPFTYEAMTQDLEELMDDLFLSDVILLGHSMGGKTVMRFAQDFPMLVERLIVADIAPKAYPVHHHMVLKGLRNVPLDQLKKRTEADEYLAKYIGEEGVRQFLMKSLYWKEKGKLDWRFNLDVIERDIELMGAPITEGSYDGPTLFLGGAKSDYILPQDEKSIHKHFPMATIQTIPDAGHWLHAEQPKLFMRSVLSFLER